MARAFTSLTDLLHHGCDTVIDVRSPAEFAEDHIPGALNLPVLDNEQRAEVGTIYVQQSPFLARKLGAALVFRNAAEHIEKRLAHHEGGWRPLVYCWRGGQRSGSFAWILAQIGWRSETIEGGYQTYRRLVNRMLYVDPLPYRFIALDGYTGTAKTDLLKRVQARGIQMLDLEGCAGHRGSLLGAMPDGQPSQKMFESRLSSALCAMDTSRPVLIEAESSKIGERILPPSLWTSLKSAPRIQITAPISARADYLVRAYDDILSDTKNLIKRLDFLREFRGHVVVDAWNDMIVSGDKRGLTQALMEQHYDPAYDKSRKLVGAPTIAEITIPDLAAPGLDTAADQIANLMNTAVQAPVTVT